MNREQEGSSNNDLTSALRYIGETMSQIRKNLQEDMNLIRKGFDDMATAARSRELEAVRRHAEMMDMIRDVRATNQANAGSNVLSQTYDGLGSRVHCELEKGACIETLMDAKGDESVPILSDEAQNELNKLIEQSEDRIYERVLVAFITPYIFPAFNDNEEKLTLINSESFPWLEPGTIGSKGKPDMFYTHCAAYVEKTEKCAFDAILNLRNNEENRNCYKMGNLADWKLRDCVRILFEAKSSLTPKTFGKGVYYIERICSELDSSHEMGLIMFDAEQIWFISVLNGKCTHITKSKWTTQGSLNHLKWFIEKYPACTWAKHLNDACVYHKVQVVEGEGFVGAGADGRVFLVIDSENNKCALKISPRMEFSSQRLFTMKSIPFNKVSRYVVPITDIHETKSYVSYIMPQIGNKLELPIKLEELKYLFESLKALHINGIVHGDPRLPNIVEVEGNLKWIDFSRSMYYDKDERSGNFFNDIKRDLEIFLKSVLNMPQNSNLGEDWKSVISEYDPITKSDASITDDLSEMINNQLKVVS